MREDKPLEEQQHHCCGMMMKEQQSLGYPDLDELMKNPQPLEFIIGETPTSYQFRTILIVIRLGNNFPR